LTERTGATIRGRLANGISQNDIRSEKRFFDCGVGLTTARA